MDSCTMLRPESAAKACLLKDFHGNPKTGLRGWGLGFSVAGLRSRLKVQNLKPCTITQLTSWFRAQSLGFRTY